MRLMFATLLLATSLPALAQAPAASERRFAVGAFDGIESSGPERVVVVPGRATSVVASGDPAILRTLEIEARGRTLHIGRYPGVYQDRGVTITVTTPTFARAQLSGSGSIHAPSTTGPRFVAGVSGSGAITVDTLEVADAAFEVSGSGDIAARGRADHLSIDVSGSGAVDTTALAARDLDLTVSGSADVRARAAGRATIVVTGSGSADVVGTRDCHATRTGSGRIACGRPS